MEFGLVLVATFFVLWALRIARNTADTAEAAARTAESSRATAAAVLRQTEVAEAALVVAFEASVVPSQTTSQRFHVAPTSCNLWVHSTSFAAVMVRGRDIDAVFDVDGFPLFSSFGEQARIPSRSRSFFIRSKHRHSNGTTHRFVRTTPDSLVNSVSNIP